MEVKNSIQSKSTVAKDVNVKEQEKRFSSIYFSLLVIRHIHVNLVSMANYSI